MRAINVDGDFEALGDAPAPVQMAGVEAATEPLARPREDGAGRVIGSVLAQARVRMGMDVAFVSEFTEDRRVFRFVDGDVQTVGLEVDGSDPLEDAYCARVVDGRIACLIPDAQQEPGVADLPVTKDLGIGAHVSVPIVFGDGRVYGTFCCFSQAANHSLTDDDVQLVRAMAAVVAGQLEDEELRAEERRVASRRIRAVLDERGPSIVFQPIVDLATRAVVGYEALSRFNAEPVRTPDIWFDEAWTAGLGVELEVAAVRRALEHLRHLPADVYMSVNVSPATVLSPALLGVLDGRHAKSVLLELTEHSQVADYATLRQALDELRARGTRVAIDDAGTGYAGIQHFLELGPDVVKLDLSVTRGVDTDPMRHSLAAGIAMVSTAAQIQVVAEGIETPAEAATLAQLGIPLGQGYYFGKPKPLTTSR